MTDPITTPPPPDDLPPKPKKGPDLSKRRRCPITKQLLKEGETVSKAVREYEAQRGKPAPAEEPPPPPPEPAPKAKKRMSENTMIILICAVVGAITAAAASLRRFKKRPAKPKPDQGEDPGTRLTSEEY